VPGLTVAGAFSFLDTEITRVITPTGDVAAGAELAFAPNVQGNLRARYEWNTDNGWTAHVMPQVIYSDRSRSDVIDINSADLDSYTVLSFSAGLAADQWRVELFADNITNERAEMSNNFVFDRERVTVMQAQCHGVAGCQTIGRTHQPAFCILDDRVTALEDVVIGERFEG